MRRQLIRSTDVLISWRDEDPAGTLDVVMLDTAPSSITTVVDLAVPLTDELVNETFNALAGACDK